MYLKFYELNEAPFNITPDPRFLFYTQNHRDAYSHLIYGIENRKGFIELTGEVGSGKTTLCRAVLTGLNKNVRTALILNPGLTQSQLLRSILMDLGLPAKGFDRLKHIETLNKFLLHQISIDHNVAVIIDEAQTLSPEVLEQIRLLSNLETDQHKLIQIVLCGQPELKARLEAPELRQLRQRITVRYHLLPLTFEETKQYIKFRLKRAGNPYGSLFTSEAVQLVFNYAKGIPRMTNSICDISLLAGYVDSAETITAIHVDRAIGQLEGAQ